MNRRGGQTAKLSGLTPLVISIFEVKMIIKMLFVVIYSDKVTMKVVNDFKGIVKQDQEGIWRLSGRFELQPKPICLPREYPIVALATRKAHGCGHFDGAYTRR
uniref:Uncharacterized protein n=1 Tax=Syphacia muris TaxID=451379 RepID=A0A0N5B0Q0_9BILA